MKKILPLLLVLLSVTTINGQEILFDINQGSTSSVAGSKPFFEWKSKLYFGVITESGGQLMSIDKNNKLDTIKQDPNSIASFDGAPGKFFTYKGLLCYLDVRDGGIEELWTYNGVEAPKQYSTNPGGFFNGIGQITEFNDSLYFFGNNDQTGFELWVFDGENQPYVRDLVPGPIGSNTGNLIVYNNYLYFTSNLPSTGQELYKMNTNGEITLVYDLVPGTGSSSPAVLGIINNKLCFYTGASSEAELFTLDENENIEEYDLVAGISQNNIFKLLFNDKYFYFRLEGDATGLELWRFDGINSPENLDLIPGLEDSRPYGLVQLGDTIAFGAYDPNDFEQDELWFLYESTGETEMFEINSNTGAGSSPSGFTIFNDTLYMSASNSSQKRGMFYFADNMGRPSQRLLRPGFLSGYPANYTEFNGDLYFTANTPEEGKEVWIMRAACKQGVFNTSQYANLQQCYGDSVLLSIDADLNTSSKWYVYKDDINTQPIDSFAVNQTYLSFTDTTQVFIQAEQVCSNAPSFAQFSVDVMPEINTDYIQNGAVLAAKQAGALSYQWINCDTEETISGATKQTYVAQENGNYKVAINYDGCQDTTDCINVTTIGINEQNAGTTIIYPNPVADELHIALNGKQNNWSKIEIVDGYGRVFKQVYNINIPDHKIDVQDLFAGTYFVRLYSNNTIETHPFIKQ